MRPTKHVAAVALEMLREANGRPVSLGAIATRAYGTDRPAEWEAYLRCVMRRLRDRGHSIYPAGRAYALGRHSKDFRSLADRSRSVLQHISTNAAQWSR